MRICLVVASLGAAMAEENPGKPQITSVNVIVYHATNGEPQPTSGNALAVPEETATRLRQEVRLRFKHYRLLGQDTQPLLKRDESWAKPLHPSDEVAVRFEAQGHPTPKSAILDLELWLGRKKTVKTDARLEGVRPLFMLGPEWRGGRLIIAVALAPNPNSKSTR